MTKFLTLSSLLLALAVTNSYAAPESYTRDSTVTTPKGVITKHEVQVVTGNGLTRETIKTNAAGQTATRKVDVVRDPATQTRTKTVEGTTFEGKTYGGQAITQRTATGVARSGEFTGPDGKVRTKDVTLTRNATTRARDVVKTNSNGRVQHKTTVRTRSH